MITIKAGVKAANKKEAYTMIQSLAAGNILQEYEIQSLLLHFAPPKTAKTGISWLAGFAAKKDIREYLRYLYSNGTRLAATNGHILAWMPTELPAGYYCPKTGAPVTGMDEIRFPDIDRVIPDISKQGAEIRLDTLPKVKHECPKNPNLFAIFDASLVAECTAGGNAMLYRPVDPNTAARGYCDKGEFVIMPRRS